MTIQTIVDRVKQLSTEEAAARLKVRPQTMRAAICRQGHYLGLVPHKLPNRLLLWDGEAIDRLTQGHLPAPTRQVA